MYELCQHSFSHLEPVNFYCQQHWPADFRGHIVLWHVGHGKNCLKNIDELMNCPLNRIFLEQILAEQNGIYSYT